MRTSPRLLARGFASLAAAILCMLPALAPAAETAPIRALLVTGGCCHDYPRQTEIITQMLPLGVDVKWDVRRYGTERDIQPDVYEDADWARDYDVVVHNECFGGVSDAEFVQRIVDSHAEHGTAAVMIHCSMHSYRAAPTADAWRALVGVTSRRHERGNRRLDVVPRKADHPILAAFGGDAWKTPNGELYVIEGVGSDTDVLATAYSTEEETEMPVIWTNQYKGVRTFGTTLGHHNETMEDPVWLETVARGLLWACDRPMNQLRKNGKAAD